ncbi:MAG: PAS domain S-box protein [Holophagaceae bacterium]|nr:PAS domain S-box protein [Holophagaceae bacterium]
MDQNYGLPCAPGNISPALFQAMVEQAGDAIIFIDNDGTIQAWSRGAEVIFGYSAAEALANSLDVIIPEPLRKAHWAGFHKAIEMGHTRNGDKILTTRAIHKDGRFLGAGVCLGVLVGGFWVLAGGGGGGGFFVGFFWGVCFLFFFGFGLFFVWSVLAFWGGFGVFLAGLAPPVFCSPFFCKVYVDLHFCIIKDDSGTAAGALAIGRDCTERYLAEKARNKAV